MLGSQLKHGNGVDIGISLKGRLHLLSASSRYLQNREESERLRKQLFDYSTVCQAKFLTDFS